MIKKLESYTQTTILVIFVPYMYASRQTFFRLEYYKVGRKM